MKSNFQGLRLRDFFSSPGDTISSPLDVNLPFADSDVTTCVITGVSGSGVDQPEVNVNPLGSGARPTLATQEGVAVAGTIENKDRYGVK